MYAKSATLQEKSGEDVQPPGIDNPMRFGDISSMPYDERTGKPDCGVLAATLPNTPAEVLFQFYADHGRNPDFIAQYANLDLTKLVWEKTVFAATDLAKASRYAPFDNWFESVRKRFDAFPQRGWQAIDSRVAVIAHWDRCGTWALPPVFLDGTLLLHNPFLPLHLVEGHTRLATLVGAVGCGQISPDSLHEIWLGK